jgi:hypothetical protein
VYLEKQNEIVWSVRRKHHPGKFEFRATQQGNSIVGVSVSLIEDSAEEKRVTFHMNYSEFHNFYEIVSKFKDLLESPYKVSQVPKIHPKQENLKPFNLEEITGAINNLGSAIPPSLGLNGDNPPSKINEEPEFGQIDMDDLEEDLAILNTLEAAFSSSESMDGNQFHPQEHTIDSDQKPNTSGDKSIGDSDLQKILDDLDSNKSKKLKETDWDPW